MRSLRASVLPTGQTVIPPLSHPGRGAGKETRGPSSHPSFLLPVFISFSFCLSLFVLLTSPHVLKLGFSLRSSKGRGSANKAHIRVSWAPTTQLP